jgi:hypothetical protein
VPANIVGNQKPIAVAVEQWFSPELGVVILTTDRSAIGNETTYQLEQIARAEPDATLFVIPPDYTRREPTVTSARTSLPDRRFSHPRTGFCPDTRLKEPESTQPSYS